MNDAQDPKDPGAPAGTPGPTPNRGRRRAPPMIEGKAEISEQNKPEPAPAPAEPQDQPAAIDPAPTGDAAQAGLQNDVQTDARAESQAAAASESEEQIKAQEGSQAGTQEANLQARLEDTQASAQEPGAGASPNDPIEPETRKAFADKDSFGKVDSSAQDSSAKSGPPVVAAVVVASALVAGAAFWAFLPGEQAGDPQANASNAGAIAALGSRVDTLERETRGAEARNSAALAGLREQLARDLTASKSLAPTDIAPKDIAPRDIARDIANPDAMAGLVKRLESVERALAASAAQGASATQGNPAEGSEPAKTQTRANMEPPAPKIDLAPLELRLAELEKSAAALNDRLKPVEERIEPLPGALTELRAALTADGASARTGADKAQAAAQAAALVVVAQSVAAAVETGKPYRPALETLAALKASPASVEALRATADGVPTFADLIAGFAKIEPALTAPPAQAEGATLLERLSRSAGALVRVRPAGEPEGDSTPDLAARIERALARGDGAAALASFQRLADRLPESAKAASAQWAGALRARTTAQEAAGALLSDAMARLARS